MFGIGMNEFLVLVLLALVFIGPKQLPEVARGIGKLLAAFRRATADLRHAVSEEINARPEYREISKLRDEISGDVRHLKDRARTYIDEEFREEQRIAGAMEHDVKDISQRVREQIEKSAQERNVSEPAPEAAEPQAAEGKTPAPEERKEFDAAYRRFYHSEQPPDAAEVAAKIAEQVPTPAAAERSADSPEEAYLRERETAQAAGEAKPGLYLLRSGGRGGPVQGHESAAPEGESALAKEDRPSLEPGRAAGGEKG
jgi:Tat protein translocase TatB subunit